MGVVDGLFRTAILIATSLLLVACSSGDRLQALLDDPVAEYNAEGIELTREWTQDDGIDLLGSPYHAEVIRLYRIRDQERKEEVLLDAVAFAEGHGWEMRESIISPELYEGSKDLDPETARLLIALGAEEPGNREGPRTLRFTLDYFSAGLERSSGK